MAGGAFRTEARFTKLDSTANNTKTRTLIAHKVKKAVLTYFFLSNKSFLAAASAYLFLSPCPRPRSKKVNQLIIVVRVIQTPYSWTPR